MKKTIKFWAIAALSLAAACGSGGKLKMEDYAVSEDQTVQFTAPNVIYDDAKVADTPAAQPTAPVERKIIREGSITFRTDDTAKTRQSIQQAIAECRGYISSDETEDYGDQTHYTLTARVPADNFDRLVGAATTTATRIDSRSISARDITEQFIDIQARLKTKKELEARYLALLRRARTVEEILSIEREAGSLRSEIESTEGRLRYLSNQVAMSTLTLTFYDRTELVQSFGFWHRMGAALGGGWRAILFLFIGLGHLWAFLLLGAGVFFGIRYWRRHNKKRKLSNT